MTESVQGAVPRMFFLRLLALHPGKLRRRGVVGTFFRQFRDAVRVRGGILQLRGALVILVMRSVIPACRHRFSFRIARVERQNGFQTTGHRLKSKLASDSVSPARGCLDISL